MKELLFDFKSNAILTIAKVVILALMAVGFYNIVSLGENVQQSVDRHFSEQANYNLYSLVDTLTNPDDFASFLSSPDKLDALGDFYNFLTNEESLVSLSAFNQPIQIANFNGGRQFSYLYGTGLEPAAAYEDPQGRLVTDVKSMQMSEGVYRFYDLKVSKGPGIRWNEISYFEETIPVLLGSSYEGLYDVGDEIAGWFYISDVVYKVAGFLEPNSAIYFKGEYNHYLDNYMVIPYPPAVDTELIPDSIYGILAFAMFNGDFAAPRTMSLQEVMVRLDTLASLSGFHEYTLLNAPTYLVQLSFSRRLVQENYSTLVALQVAMAIVAVITVVLLEAALLNRRKGKIRVWNLMGMSGRWVSATYARFWAMEYIPLLVLLFAVVVTAPNKSETALMIIFGGVLCAALLDLIFQLALLRFRTIES